MTTAFQSHAKTVNRDLIVLALFGALVLGLSAFLSPLVGLPHDTLRPVDFVAEVVTYGLAALVFDWPVHRDDIDERRSARVLAVALAVAVLITLAALRSQELSDDALCVAGLFGWKCFQIWFDREEITEWP